jgi:hypothetical protein
MNLAACPVGDMAVFQARIVQNKTELRHFKVRQLRFGWQVRCLSF